jgi:predicted methyltransferase
MHLHFGFLTSSRPSRDSCGASAPRPPPPTQPSRPPSRILHAARISWRATRRAIRPQSSTFFGIKPNMTVVELWPGGGYWTEILGRTSAKQGTYYVALEPSANKEAEQSNAKLAHAGRAPRRAR